MIPIPHWILDQATPRFVELARACPLCAWAVLAIGLLSVATCVWWFVVCVWRSARGYQLFKGGPRPVLATGARALTGLVWLLALVVFAWLAGQRGFVPLLGDTIFIAFA